MKLRSLLGAVDVFIPTLPSSFIQDVSKTLHFLLHLGVKCIFFLFILTCLNHFQVQMAQNVLSTDMASLIAAMKLAIQYSTTTMDVEYRKSMLKAAHVLAMDSKNLLDVVDKTRVKVKLQSGPS